MYNIYTHIIYLIYLQDGEGSDCMYGYECILHIYVHILWMSVDRHFFRVHIESAVALSPLNREPSCGRAGCRSEGGCAHARRHHPNTRAHGSRGWDVIAVCGGGVWVHRGRAWWSVMAAVLLLLMVVSDIN